MARKKSLPKGMRYRPNGRIEYRFRFNDKQYSVTGNTSTECLNKEKQTLEAEVKRVQGKLNNPGFTAKAPAHLVEEERQKAENE